MLRDEDVDPFVFDGKVVLNLELNDVACVIVCGIDGVHLRQELLDEGIELSVEASSPLLVRVLCSLGLLGALAHHHSETYSFDL